MRDKFGRVTHCPPPCA